MDWTRLDPFDLFHRLAKQVSIFVWAGYIIQENHHMLSPWVLLLYILDVCLQQRNCVVGVFQFYFLTEDLHVPILIAVVDNPENIV